VNRRAALFLLLYLAAILYLSLYPWRFVRNPGPGALIWVPLDTRRTILDAFLNVVFYIPLGAAAFARGVSLNMGWRAHRYIDGTLSHADFVTTKAHCLEIFQREVRRA